MKYYFFQSFFVIIFAIEIIPPKMKTNYIRLITFIALVSIIALQGIWLYNTYKLLETEFKKNISDLFIFSVEKETINLFVN